MTKTKCFNEMGVCMKLDEAIELIRDLDKDSMKKAKMKLDNLTKPLGSLGKLEDIVQRLAGIFGCASPMVDKKAIIVMCADNGVYDEKVSSCPKEVTSSVTKNFTRGITGINVFAKMTGADLLVFDIGVDDDLSFYSGIINKKIRRGTDNIVKGSAMTREEALTAIEIGIDAMGQLKEKGYNIVATGEMGIGNTTTSSAMAAVLMQISPYEVVGKGAGLTSDGLNNKIEVVKRSIEINKPNCNDPIDVISKVGGFDIAGLTGCFIGAAAYRIPIIIDGFISSVAALAAIKIEPKVRDFIFPSHASAEPGGMKVLSAMNFEPIFLLDMRLGEGTGAALAFMVFDAATEAYNKMGTFEDAIIEQYIPLD